MTEQEANRKLFEKESLYLKPIGDKKAVYCSVIKKSNDPEVKDDFVIEIGYTSGDSSHIDSIQKLLNEPEFHVSIIEDINKGIVLPIIDTDEVFLESLKTEIVCKDIFNECSKRYEALTGGISVYHKYSSARMGTAGAFFRMIGSQDIFMISNYHVLASGRKTKLGNKIVQPSVADAYHNHYPNKDHEIGRLYWSKLDDTLDAAIVKLYTEKEHGIKVATGRYTRCNHLKIKGIEEAKIGDNISKCGRTSGLTYGEIRSTNATVIAKEKKVFKNNRTIIKQHLFRNQIQYTCMTDDGDSGSIIVNENDYAVGLHFAGNKKNASFSNKLSLIFGPNFPHLNINKFL